MSEAKITQEDLGDDVLFNADHPDPLPLRLWCCLPDSETTKRKSEVFDPLDFLTRVTQHIPDHDQHLTRYYCWYSNVGRGRRAKADTDSSTEQTSVNPALGAHQRWAIIETVYEVDPFVCPRCGEDMNIIAFIRNPAVVHSDPGPPGFAFIIRKRPVTDPTNSERHYEPIYGDLPPGDPLLPDG